jgi:hypothetical protein
MISTRIIQPIVDGGHVGPADDPGQPASRPAASTAGSRLSPRTYISRLAREIVSFPVTRPVKWCYFLSRLR